MQLFQYLAQHPGPFLPGELTGYSSTVEAETLAEAQALAEERIRRVIARTGRQTVLAGVALVPVEARR